MEIFQKNAGYTKFHKAAADNASLQSAKLDNVGLQSAKADKDALKSAKAGVTSLQSSKLGNSGLQPIKTDAAVFQSAKEGNVATQSAKAGEDVLQLAKLDSIAAQSSKANDVVEKPANRIHIPQTEAVHGTNDASAISSGGVIHCLTIIGQVEGHQLLPEDNKSTKYEHVCPLLAAIEESSEIGALLVLLNTAGGDVDAGLAIAELIAGLTLHRHPPRRGGEPQLYRAFRRYDDTSCAYERRSNRRGADV